MIRSLLQLTWLVLFAGHSFAQTLAPVIKTQRCIGGNGSEDVGFAHTMLLKEEDGGFIVASTTNTYNNGDISGGHYDGVTLQDLWVAKLDSTYHVQWQVALGGFRGDEATTITKAKDGGYVVGGMVLSEDGDVSGNHGNRDLWLVKLDKLGQIQWQRCYGGIQSELAYHIEPAGNNGYIVIGNTESTDGDLAGNTEAGIWVLRIDNLGAIIWQKVFPATGALGANAKIRATPDGGFLAGFNKLINGFQDLDVVLVKLDAGGNISWEKTFTEPDWQYIQDLEYLPGGDILLCGYINSNTNSKGNGWIWKLNANGDRLWQQIRGGSEWDVYCDMVLMPDQTILVGGFTSSSDNGISTHSGFDYWLLKYDTDGNLIWDKTYGGIGDEYLATVDYLHNGDVVMYGQSNSNSMDVVGNHGGNDGWLVKVSAANVISGSIYYDANSNGARDAGERLSDNAKVIIEHWGQPVATLMPYKGLYELAVDTGTYSISVVPFYNYHTVQPASSQASFTGLLNTHTQHFGIQAIPGKQDLAVHLLPITPARPGFPVQYRILYRNVGTETIASGSVTLDKDHRLVYVSAAPLETSRSGDHISWQFTNLQPADSASIIVNLTLDAINAHPGDSLLSIANILPLAGDLAPLDNIARLKQWVTGSYDPNDKIESNGGLITPEQVTSGEYLTYMIRFQNTGTDTAFNVFIRDTLDSRLNRGSFQMIAASHDYSLQIEDSVAVWTFNNILLPDSNVNKDLSHGYIAYRIQPHPTVPIGDTIKNTAGIYFDYNLAVMTNTDNTVVISLTPLPVNLLSFNAALNGAVVDVRWKTSMEINVRHFEVLRSVDGINFNVIGTVQPGSSNYIYKDEHPQPGYNYYRLRTVDVDGAIDYSSIALVKVGADGRIISSIYPNPGPGQLINVKLQGIEPGQVTIEVMDGVGRKLSSRQYHNPQSGEFRTELPLRNLSRGSYILKVTANGKAYLHKLLVQ